MHFAFSSLLTLAAAAATIAQPTEKLSLNPDRGVVHNTPLKARDVPFTPATNAKRLAAGLPPLRPRVHRRQHAGPHGGGTGVASAPRGVQSPLPPVNFKCNILVKGVDGTTFGYISPVWNVFGEYGIVQAEQDGSLEVSFSSTRKAPGDRLDFLATNGPGAAYPNVGATVGFVSPSDNLVVGGYNYAYITGTTPITPGPPLFADNNSFGGTTGIPKSAESAIWQYDPKTEAITAQWTNTDGSLPPTHILYANDFNQAFLLSADPAVLRSTFGANYPDVTFTCVHPKKEKKDKEN